MLLPPGFLDELRTRLSLAQVVGRKVMWDAHKSNQGRDDMWAPCPFHHEKTAWFFDQFQRELISHPLLCCLIHCNGFARAFERGPTRLLCVGKSAEVRTSK